MLKLIAEWAGILAGLWLAKSIFLLVLSLFLGYVLIGAGQCTYKSATGDKTMLVAPQIDPEFRR